jgi:hypothetical protein
VPSCIGTAAQVLRNLRPSAAGIGAQVLPERVPKCARNTHCVARGGSPNARTNERRIRSRLPKPLFRAISSAEKRPAFIISCADSMRSRSIAFRGRPSRVLLPRERHLSDRRERA